MKKAQASEPASQPLPDVVGAAPPVPVPEKPSVSFHCPYRRATDLLQRLAPSKMRVGFFIGAGCPLAVRVPDGNGGSRALIPEIAGLTKQVKTLLDANDDLKASAQTAWERVIARGIPEPTVEDVLSHIRTLKSLCGGGQIDGFTEQILKDLDEAICDEVRKVVSQPLPNSGTPYHILASWIQAISRENPVEVFTSNYDLLLERAMEDQRVPYFDGFVGSDSAFLDLESMAEDDLPPRWARIWKIHGSINWWMTSEKKLRRSRDKVPGEQLLIYPSHLKYDQSRQMPYYAMLDRLRVFLRKEQCVLLVCGYSFGDEHINAFIGQGLSGNPNAACFGLIYKDLDDAPLAIDLAKRHANLTILATDGAIIGTVRRDWSDTLKDDHPVYSMAIGFDVVEGRTKSPKERCKWLLGDFGALGRFLGHQLSTRDIEQGMPE